jgi:hypothetical protein
MNQSENVNGNLVDVVKSRLPRMSCAFAKLRKRVFSNRNVRSVTELRMFDTVVITNGLYRCAIQNINQKLKVVGEVRFMGIQTSLGDFRD